jgi:hypothetical protein
MPDPGSPEARRIKMMAVAREIGLTRDERIELAQYLLRRDITSWKQLTDEQVNRMLDCLEGFELITHLLTLQTVSASDLEPDHTHADDRSSPDRPVPH